MSVAERKRLVVLAQVRDGAMSVAAGSRLMGVSERHGWRLKRRYVREGDDGLAHRLRGVRDMAPANRLLESGFLDARSKKFAVAAKRKGSNLHRRVTRQMKLDEALCVHEERAVARDWCVQWRGRLLQIDRQYAALDLPRPGRRVVVIEKFDGSLLVRYGKVDLIWREVMRRPAKTKAAKKSIVNNKVWTPAANHPFRRSLE